MDRRTQNINMLAETLAVCKKGFYRKGLRKIRLHTTAEERCGCKVYIPGDVQRIGAYRFPNNYSAPGKHGVSCENADSFTMARKLSVGENDKVLVLNFANAVNPGGGVRRAIKDFEYSGMAFGSFFKSVDFAVLDRSEEKSNFKAFGRYFTFDNFYSGGSE